MCGYWISINVGANDLFIIIIINIIIIVIEKEGANEFRYVWLVRKERKY